MLSTRLRPLIAAVYFLALSATAAPITDTILVGSTEWAQVDLFDGLAWDEINAVCPSGVCGSGTLNGFEVDGWTWASIDEVNALFNLYLVDAGVATGDLLGPGPDRYEERGGTFIDGVIADGWRDTAPSISFFQVVGFTANEVVADPNFAYAGAVLDDLPNPFAPIRANLNTDESWRKEGFSSVVGAWFFREPVTAVPVSGTLSLVLVGLLLLSRPISGFRQRV